MKFWDSSALVPLLVAEAQSASCAGELADDRHVVVWAGAPLEAAGAPADIRERIFGGNFERLFPA